MWSCAHASALCVLHYVHIKGNLPSSDKSLPLFVWWIFGRSGECMEEDVNARWYDCNCKRFEDRGT